MSEVKPGQLWHTSAGDIYLVLHVDHDLAWSAAAHIIFISGEHRGLKRVHNVDVIKAHNELISDA